MNDAERAIEDLKDINTILKTQHMCKVLDDELTKKDVEDYKSRFASVNLAISALEKQLNGGWIPVSERLPEKEDIYQVTIKYKNFAGIHLTVRTAIYENEKWNIHGSQPVISNRKIIAWQPLPEPYKEVENGVENKKST